MKNNIFPHTFWRPFLDCMPQLFFRPKYVWFPIHLKGPMIPDPSGQLAELIVYITSTRVDLYSHQILLSAIIMWCSIRWCHIQHCNQWLKQNLNQNLITQKTQHTSPSRTSYGVSFAKIWEKFDPIMIALHYMCKTVLYYTNLRQKGPDCTRFYPNVLWQFPYTQQTRSAEEGLFNTYQYQNSQGTAKTIIRSPQWAFQQHLFNEAASCHHSCQH